MSLYTMNGRLATHHDMESSLLSKAADHVDHLNDLDQQSSRSVVSNANTTVFCYVLVV